MITITVSNQVMNVIAIGRFEKFIYLIGACLIHLCILYIWMHISKFFMLRIGKIFSKDGKVDKEFCYSAATIFGFVTYLLMLIGFYCFHQ